MGKIEGSEQCDTGGVYKPCCINCTLVVSCDDKDACTVGDTCDGTLNLTCRGNYNCGQNTECMTISCNSTNGTCIQTPRPDFTPCGGTNDLCLKRCVAGVCNVIPVVCPADNDTTDCYENKCISPTGICGPVVNVSLGCSDGNGCTINDRCVPSGVCTGTPKVCEQSPNVCINVTCRFGNCEPTLISGKVCNADNDACTIGDVCVLGVCSPGTPRVCEVDKDDVCHFSRCNAVTGECLTEPRPNYENITCDDLNICTRNDLCVNGTCIGDVDPNTQDTEQCAPISPSAVNNTIIIFSVAGAAALIGAIVGLAFLIKRIRDSNILSPDTWNPDTFSSVGANPLYKGNQKIVDNRLFEGST